MQLIDTAGVLSFSIARNVRARPCRRRIGDLRLAETSTRGYTRRALNITAKNNVKVRYAQHDDNDDIGVTAWTRKI